MQKPHNEPHPIELLLLAAWLAAEAVLELLRLVAVPLVAAALALLPAPCRRPAAQPAAAPPPADPAPPTEHPLAVLAAELGALPQRQLMAMAGARRRLPKRQLAAMLVAMA